jgi:hypothetical protein
VAEEYPEGTTHGEEYRKEIDIFKLLSRKELKETRAYIISVLRCMVAAVYAGH